MIPTKSIPLKLYGNFIDAGTNRLIKKVAESSSSLNRCLFG